VFTNVTITGAGKAGIGIVSHDGGAITDIHYTGIRMNRVAVPIFIRLGGRGNCPGTPPPGRIDGVTITDVTGTNLTSPAPVRGGPEHASTIIGTPGANVTNVTITNVNLSMPGGHPASDADLVPPDRPIDYRPREFGTRPAYGFWLRHVDGVTFDHTTVQFDKADGRPAFAVDDGRRIQLVDSRVERSAGPFDARFTGTQGVTLTRTTTTAGDPLRVRSLL
jgi:hypothetical protein